MSFFLAQVSTKVFHCPNRPFSIFSKLFLDDTFFLPLAKATKSSMCSTTKGSAEAAETTSVSGFAPSPWVSAITGASSGPAFFGF